MLGYDLYQDAARPSAGLIVTGETLFVGDMGRPPLMASVDDSPAALAGMLDDFLYQNLLTLPNEILAQPAHGAGLMN
jgi:glyoxylase-like metal-dependent hydrolase (beta-lactamase superfamily II)